MINIYSFVSINIVSAVGFISKLKLLISILGPPFGTFTRQSLTQKLMPESNSKFNPSSSSIDSKSNSPTMNVQRNTNNQLNHSINPADFSHTTNSVLCSQVLLAKEPGLKRPNENDDCANENNLNPINCRQLTKTPRKIQSVPMETEIDINYNNHDDLPDDAQQTIYSNENLSPRITRSSRHNPTLFASQRLRSPWRLAKRRGINK